MNNEHKNIDDIITNIRETLELKGYIATGETGAKTEYELNKLYYFLFDFVNALPDNPKKKQNDEKEQTLSSAWELQAEKIVNDKMTLEPKIMELINEYESIN